MGVKKSDLTAELAKLGAKWAKETRDTSLTNGQRIELFYKIAKKANELLDKGARERDVREAIGSVAMNASSGKPIQRTFLGRVLRLHRIDPTVISDLAKHKPREGKVGISIFHLLELGKVTDRRSQRRLAKLLINETPSIRHFTDEVKRVAPEATTPSAERPKTLIKKLEDAANLLAEGITLFTSSSFLERAKAADHRTRDEVIEMLDNIRDSLEIIAKRAPDANTAIEQIQSDLNTLIEQDKEKQKARRKRRLRALH